MRVLHTSDWHLGADLEGLSRAEEQEHFLCWLYSYLEEHAIDVLLVAGDIFQHAHPSAAAQRLFYRFVQRLSGLPTLRHAVFIGGNHDSPSRLEAPEALYDREKVTMIGGYRADALAEMLVPIEGATGEVELVVAAVPYVHESRLRVSVAESTEALRLSTIEAFRALYSSLADQAKERWPNAQLVGMGHLTCGQEASEEDYSTPLHNVGTIDALPASIFPADRYRYVALGHIHSGYRIDGSPANYSGAPLTMRFNASEMRERQVVDLCLRTEKMTRVPIPLIRDLVQIRGDYAQVTHDLRALRQPKELETWVNIILQADEPLLDPVSHFREMAPPGVLVCTARIQRLTPLDLFSDVEDLPDLRSMTPKDVFLEMYRLRHGEEPAPTVLQKFDYAMQLALEEKE